MATANLLIKFYAYDDETATYDPQLVVPDWNKEIEDIITGDANGILTFDSITRALPTGDTTIGLPATTITFLYIEADGTIYVKLNGGAETNNIVTPSAVGTRDGVFLKKGNITGLVLNNPGATAVNTKIFLGV